MNDVNKIARRKVIIGMGAGLAAVTIKPFLGNAQNTGMEYGSPKDLEDPVTKYPRPPFQEQSQPWPGLAGKMNPRPDHGEKSYKGSGRLSGRKALITGGDSGHGTGRSHRVCT